MLKNKKRTALASVLGAGVALAAAGLAAAPASAATTTWLGSSNTLVGGVDNLTQTRGIVQDVATGTGWLYVTPTSDITGVTSYTLTFTAPDGVTLRMGGAATGKSADGTGFPPSCANSGSSGIRCSWSGSAKDLNARVSGTTVTASPYSYFGALTSVTVAADAKGPKDAPIVVSGTYVDSTGTNTIDPTTVATLDLPIIEATPVVNPYIAAGGLVAATAAGGAILVMRRRKASGQSA